MFTTSRSSLILLAWLVALPCIGLAAPPQMDASLAQYLQAISKYSTIKYSAKYYCDSESSKPRTDREKLEGLVLLQKFDAKIDLANKYFYTKESCFPDDLDGSINRVTSWHKGVMREYVDDHSPGLSKGIQAADGVIKQHEIESGDLPPGPRVALGFGITEGVGNSHDLADLILHSTAETLSTNRYLIKNVFDWRESFGSAYDLEFTLDPDHDYLPKTFAFWDRTFGEKTSREKLAECTVNRFAKSNGLWCPVDTTHISYAGSKVASKYRVVLSERSLELNFSTTEADFVLTFPADKTYLDVAKKTLHKPLKAPIDISSSFVQAAAFSQPHPVTNEQSVNRFLYGVPLAAFFISAITLLALKLRSWHKGPFYVLLGWVLFSLSGCGSRTSEPVWERLDLANDDLQLVVAGGKNRDVEMPVGESSDRSVVVFELLNKGRQAIQIEGELNATCGCVQATADKTELQPGESCRISASLSQSASPAKRTVSLELTVVAPHYSKANLFVNVSHVGDWSVNSKSVELKGELGSQSERSIEINGRKQALDAMTWNVSGDLQVKADRLSDSQLVLTVQSKIDSLLKEKIAGTIELLTAAGMPTQTTLTVTQMADPIGKWSPKALVLAQDNPVGECQMDLVDGAAVTRIEAPGFEVTTISDTQPARFAVAIDSKTSSGVQWVIATVSKGAVDQQVKLPVLVKWDSPSEDAKHVDASGEH